MTYKARRSWALVVLLIGMPVYVIIALNVMARIDRLPIWAEVPVYILLGTAWIWPFKRVFTGIGQADPDEGDPNRDA